MFKSVAGAQKPLEQVRVELGRGNYEGAAKIADKLLAENPKDVDAMVVYGFGMLWKKDYDKSEKLFNRVLELAPDYGDAAIGLIKNYTWSGRMDKLRQIISKASVPSGPITIRRRNTTSMPTTNMSMTTIIATPITKVTCCIRVP